MRPCDIPPVGGRCRDIRGSVTPGVFPRPPREIPSPPCIYRYLITAGMRYGIVGAAMWGKPVARMEDQETMLELLRFWTVDWTPPNAESKALAAMIRDIDGKGRFDRLIAYASTGEGHEGTIYKATNWTDEGVRTTSSGDGWENRDGRTNSDTSPKRKFVYHLTDPNA